MNTNPKTKQELWELYHLHKAYQQRWGGDITRSKLIDVRSIFDLGLSEARSFLQWINSRLEVKVYPLELGAVQAYSLSPNGGIVLRGVNSSILSTRQDVLEYFDELIGLEDVMFLFQD